MILSAIISLFFHFFTGAMSLLPNGIVLPGWINEGLKVLTTGLCFFPVSIFSVIIGNVAFWITVDLIYAVIEWVYKKIPGIN